jgi:hypothetical protein
MINAERPRLTRLRWGTGWPASDSTYQIEPKSPLRSELYCQKLRHASGARTITGRLAASQPTTNAVTIDQKSGIRRDRKHSRKSGPSSRPG